MEIVPLFKKLNNYQGAIIDGITEIVDSEVPIYSSNLWADAPYLEERINKVLHNGKQYETILDVISVAYADYLTDTLTKRVSILAKEHGWDGKTSIDITKGWNQFEHNNANKC